MRDSTSPPDWTTRLDRYVLVLMTIWSIVVLLSLLWNLAQHKLDTLSVQDNSPFWVELVGHAVMWWIGAVGLCIGTQQIVRRTGRPPLIRNIQACQDWISRRKIRVTKLAP